MPARRTQYLVDASMYVFRAWFSMPDSMTDSSGWPVNAVYGYTHFLCQLIEQHRPGYIAVAFDESLSEKKPRRGGAFRSWASLPWDRTQCPVASPAPLGTRMSSTRCWMCSGGSEVTLETR